MLNIKAIWLFGKQLCANMPVGDHAGQRPCCKGVHAYLEIGLQSQPNSNCVQAKGCIGC